MAGGQDAYATHSPEDAGVLVGVGVMTGFMEEASLFQGTIHEGDNHDGNKELPDGETGLGPAHDGMGGVGVGVGREVVYEIGTTPAGEHCPSGQTWDL